MKFLVVDGGGRGHILCSKLAQSRHTSAIWCAPGNPGIGAERLSGGSVVQCVDIETTDVPKLLAFAKERRPDVIIVGPEQALEQNLAGVLRTHGFKVYGPDKKAARIETSKVFSQKFMKRHGIPCAPGEVFERMDAALSFAKDLGGECVVKYPYLARGTGSTPCETLDEARTALRRIFETRDFGDSQPPIVVIQKLLKGRELSLQAICTKEGIFALEPSRDYKWSHEGDTGTMSGGMGAYSPTPEFAVEEVKRIEGEIYRKFLHGCEEEGITFSGTLFPGIMWTKEGPKVLELGVRFGDPEIIPTLMRLESDLPLLFLAAVEDRFTGYSRLNWSNEFAVCVELVTAGYPEKRTAPEAVIHGLPAASALPHVKVFHAGTRMHGTELVTRPGRVIAVTATGSTLKEARESAYRAANLIQFEGKRFRKDIAK